LVIVNLEIAIVEKIYRLVTETPLGGDVQRAVLLNPKTSFSSPPGCIG
jgi:hypothetical protein